MNAERFEQLWKRNVSAVPGSWDGARAFAELERLYNLPGRYYHDASHIDLCLQWLDRYAATVADPDAVELAIWFHDACYLPDPKGHEARSAQLFTDMVGDGMAAERRGCIVRMIGFTTHCTIPQTPEEALLVDIDLASFARPWHQYVIDTARCRAERKLVDDLAFCGCQINFLECMLARPHFYFSPSFKRNHEQSARDNITRMLQLLYQRKARLAKSESEVQSNTPVPGCCGL